MLGIIGCEGSPSLLLIQPGAVNDFDAITAQLKRICDDSPFKRGFRHALLLVFSGVLDGDVLLQFVEGNFEFRDFILALKSLDVGNDFRSKPIGKRLNAFLEANDGVRRVAVFDLVDDRRAWLRIGWQDLFLQQGVDESAFPSFEFPHDEDLEVVTLDFLLEFGKALNLCVVAHFLKNPNGLFEDFCEFLFVFLITLQIFVHVFLLG